MIFHLPFEPDKTRLSASQIRPYKMINAFQNVGYEVALVIGSAKTRKDQIKHIKKRILNGEKFDFLYSESSTMPTMLTESHHLPTYPFLDFGFFYFLKKNKIPIGLFYRDIHWKFKHYNVSFFKKSVSTLFYKLDLFLYKKLVDVIFLPSIEMKEYILELNSLKILSLPPGSEKPNFEIGVPKKKNDLKILYVGGLGDLYNLELFLITLTKLKNKNIQFTICTRKTDYELVKEMYDQYLEFENINLVHAGGEELKNLYRTSDMCCLFVKPSQYWEFAMPVKLFEYIAFEKPIIAVKNTSVGNYVKEKNIGWAIDYDADQLSVFFKKIIHNELDYNILTDNLAKDAQANTWESRANYVANCLKNFK
ncbi:glycosyltransferase [Cecembia calidifontis]|uniref:Glycosyltransferase involved in cell wall biosynthesis n=1 Tax=Cecembia calidifontis TaxID=1187080 RepID=A0A4V2F6L1_9BACT|nr:glycosyltransferase [Cecembia calidifontis]RZS96699.1 glycosyltransferase involved in cell wall biosynthesis [Cecembia calidifontis]